MGAVAVCSALGGCLRCGMVRGDGGGSAGHAGVGQAGDSMKLTFPHKPAKVTSRLSTRARGNLRHSSRRMTWRSSASLSQLYE